MYEGQEKFPKALKEMLNFHVDNLKYPRQSKELQKFSLH